MAVGAAFGRERGIGITMRFAGRARSYRERCQALVGAAFGREGGAGITGRFAGRARSYREECQAL
jgi:hypothetical protein